MKFISEAKTKVLPLEEKEHQQVMLLQNELIKASEDGSLEKVKAAIAKGALVDLHNKEGKNPLYCAVYGMNPEVVQYLIKQREVQCGGYAPSWSACEEHNKEHYRQTFLITKFAPYYYRDWYDLLLKIEPNEFLAGYHLAQCQKMWRWGGAETYGKLKSYAGWGGIRPLGDGSVMVKASRWSEKGYEVNRNQIKQAIERLQVAKTPSVSEQQRVREGKTRKTPPNNDTDRLPADTTALPERPVVIAASRSQSVTVSFFPPQGDSVQQPPDTTSDAAYPLMNVDEEAPISSSDQSKEKASCCQCIIL